jgi:beta-lactamase hcpA (cysteine-rich 28 kDaprotein)
LGILYEIGQGVKQDYKKAIQLYQKACDERESAACYRLGALYENGKVVEQNLSTAKKYFSKTCSLGFYLGCDSYKRLNKKDR